MASVQVNFIAVLVCSVVTFLIGGLWYSPFLFAKKWVALLGKSPESMGGAAPNPLMFVIGFLTGLITSYVLAVVVNLSAASSVVDGVIVGIVCWLGFAGATSYNNQVNFVQRPRALWAIDSGYNLVTFVITGAILAIWR